MRLTWKVVLATAILSASFAPALPAAASSIVSLMKGDLGDGRPSGCPSAWCACYLEHILKQAGLKQLGSNAARDFAKYGRKASAGQVGAIMVMPHHVGVVIGKCDDGRVKLISGNHDHEVGIGCYAKGKAIAWRLPA